VITEESRIAEKIFGSLIAINSHFIQLHLKSEDLHPTIKSILHAAIIVDKYPLHPLNHSQDSVTTAFLASSPTNSDNQRRRQWDTVNVSSNKASHCSNILSNSQEADRNRKYKDEKIRKHTRSSSENNDR